MSLFAAPCSRKQANEFVALHHRHHSPMNDAAFCVAVADESGSVHGVAMCGRPANPMVEDGLTVEVRRLCTDGHPNACSFLLGACKRASRALGYAKIQTYTLLDEGGGSLRGAGWVDEHQTTGKSTFSDHRSRTKSGERQAPRRVGTTAAADRARQQGVKVRWAVCHPSNLAIPATWPQLPEPDLPLFSMIAKAKGEES